MLSTVLRLSRTGNVGTSAAHPEAAQSEQQSHHEMPGPSTAAVRNDSSIAREGTGLRTSRHDRSSRIRLNVHYTSDSSNEPVEDLQPSGILDREAMSGHFSLQNLLGSGAGNSEPHLSGASNRASDGDPVLLGLINLAIARSLFERYVLGRKVLRTSQVGTRVKTYASDCSCSSRIEYN